MIEFSRSAQSTLGVEWEVALVDRRTGATRPAAEEVFEAIEAADPELADPEGQTPHIAREFLANTVEMVTGVATRVSEATDQLQHLTDRLRAYTDPLGIDLFSAGTHPLAEWRTEQVSAKERYQKVLDRTQYWGHQMLMYGIHVHVGIDARDKALPVVNQLVNYYPHLLALSANSPYWGGHDTGYASQRAMIFQQIPTAGLPFGFEQWHEFEDYTRDLLQTGVIDEASENRWDIRPVAKYGTVEMRVCDGVSTLEEIGALTALTQCLVEETSRRVEAGERIPLMPRWHAEENKWRAARYGIEAIIIQDARNNERLVTDDTIDLLNRLEPIAGQLGCSEELAGVERIIRRGPGYLRQRRIAKEAGGDLRAVVRDIAELTRNGFPEE
jgi:carboxylate-amine ligase